MGNIRFILIDESEKRVMPKADISTLDAIVDALSRNPATIKEFNGLYKLSAGESLYDDGNRASQTLFAILKRTSSDGDALRKMEVAGIRDKEPNYQSFKPDEETPYDIPEAVGKGLNLRDTLRDIDAGIVIVDLRSRQVRYLSESFDITKEPGQYVLPAEWKIVSYSLELKETEN